MNPLRNSKNSITPVVITSKAAQKDVQDIGLKHDEMVTGINLQNARVSEYKQQKAAEMANMNAMQMEIDKSKQVADTETQKIALDHQIRLGELDIKRASLTAK